MSTNGGEARMAKEKMGYFRIDEHDMDRLKILADKDRRTVSSLIRIIIESYLDLNSYKLNDKGV